MRAIPRSSSGTRRDRPAGGGIRPYGRLPSIRVKPLLRRAWPLARRYWFDALVVIGICLGTATAIVHRQAPQDGPAGPGLVRRPRRLSSSSCPSSSGGVSPSELRSRRILLLRRCSFVDDRLIHPSSSSPCSRRVFACGLFAHVAAAATGDRGWLLALAVLGIVDSQRPEGQVGDLFWISILLTIAWLVGFAFSGASRQAEEAKERARRAEREREERARWPSPRSVRASPANCTTSSGTA